MVHGSLAGLLAACSSSPPPERVPAPVVGPATLMIDASAAAGAQPVDAGVEVAEQGYAAPPPDAAPPPPSPADAAPVADVQKMTNAQPRRVPPKGCWKPGDPRIAKLQARAARSSRAAYEAELKRRGLKRAQLQINRKELHKGIRGGGNQPPVARAGTIVTEGGQRYIAGNSYWTGNARMPQRWELVINDAGEIYRVDRSPYTGPKSKHVVLCGCAPQKCGPYGSGCPACHSTIQELYGPLPEGATFKGRITVQYYTTEVTTAREQGTCQPIRPCPPPPP